MSLYVSHANQWIPCPGSYRIQQTHPRPIYAATINGIQEHEEARAGVVEGKPIVTPQVQDYVDFIMDGNPRRRIIEEKLPLTTDELTLNVKADCVNIFHERIDVWDYKAGFTPVTAKSNWQLLAAAMATLDNIPEAAADVPINLYIFQPRLSSKPDLWTVDAEDLRSHRVILFNAAKNALSDNPTTASGYWCHNCGGLAFCHTAKLAEQRALGFAGYLLDAERTPELIGEDLTVLKAAKSYLDKMIIALEARVSSEIKRGRAIPGWELETSRSRIVWEEGRDLGPLSALADQMGVSMWKKDPITPKQLIDAGLPEAVVKLFTQTKPGSLTLKQKGEIIWPTIS
jgi:hypothetical protein